MKIREQEVAWLLRIYGPCPAAVLVHRSRHRRETVVAALTRLRHKGLAERCMRARYRLTDSGRSWLAGVTPSGERQLTLEEIANIEASEQEVLESWKR